MISFCAMSDAGGREYNEDRVEVLVTDDRWCCILADGLGGMGGGAEASKAAVDTLKACFEDGFMQPDTLHECCQRAHRAIQQKKRELGQRGKLYSTIVLVFGTENMLWWTHSGDSRLYLFKDGHVCAQTKDNSVPQMLVACGEITPQEIRNHPDRNRILACLGTDDEVAKLSKVGQMEITEGLSGLLCTDGFWEPVVEEEMIGRLEREKDVQKWIRNMVRYIQQQDLGQEQDNFSAIGFVVE